MAEIETREEIKAEQPAPKLTAEAAWGQTCRVRGCTDDVADGPDCARHQLVSAF